MRARWHIGERVREVRLRRGLRQEDLAATLGRYESTVSKIESGRRTVASEEVFALAFALNVCPLDLMLPADDAEDVQVAPGVVHLAGAVRAWAAGRGPLALDVDVDDPAAGRAVEDAYFELRPAAERREYDLQHSPAVVALDALREAVLDVLAGQPVEADGLRRAELRVRRHVEALAADLAAATTTTPGEAP